MKKLVQIVVAVIVLGGLSLTSTAQRPRTVTRTNPVDTPWARAIPDPNTFDWTVKDGCRAGYAYLGFLPKHEAFYEYIQQKRENDLPLTSAEEALVRYLITIRRWPDPPAPNPFWAAFMQYLREQSNSQLSVGEIILLDQLNARGLIVGELPPDANTRRVLEYLSLTGFQIRNWFERIAQQPEPFVDDLNSGWGYDLPYDAPYDPAVADEMYRRVTETLRRLNDSESAYGREAAKIQKALSEGEDEWQAFVAMREKELREDKSTDSKSYRELHRAVMAGGKTWKLYVQTHLGADPDGPFSEEPSSPPNDFSTENPDPASELIREAEAHLEKREDAQAVFDFTRAIDANRNSADAYAGRALAKTEMNDVDGASRDIFQALKLDPSCALAYRVRSIIKRALADPAGALADANRAVALAPSDYRVYFTRGSAFEAMKDYGAAAFDYSFVIYRNPGYALAFLRRGFVRLYLDQNEGAIADFDRFIKTDSNNSMAFAHRGLAKERTGNIEGAIADYKQAVLINPREDLANRALARLTP